MMPLVAPMSEPLSIVPKFRAHHASRPMLARDADSMYWMTRYVERAEHIARLLLINSNLLMDVGELAPALEQRQWESVMIAMRVDGHLPGSESSALVHRVGLHMTFNAENPNSVFNCITR